MRTLKRGDEGIVMVLTIIAMTALLACASLAIDIGQTAASTRAVQNSADSAALAAANDCARGVPIRSLTPYGNGATASCDMGTSTATGTASKTVDRLFGTLTIPTQRSATAKWAGLLKTTAPMPITIAACEFTQAILDGTAQITLLLDDPNPHTGCSSPSGGFGRLNPSSGDCNVTPVLAGGVWTVDGKSGNDLQKIRPCLDAILNTPTLVPLYDDAACSGRCQGNMQYPIKGYAAIVLTGYFIKFQKSAPWVSCTNDCIIGDFVRFYLPNDIPGAVPGGPDFGAVRAYLSS